MKDISWEKVKSRCKDNATIYDPPITLIGNNPDCTNGITTGKTYIGLAFEVEKDEYYLILHDDRKEEYVWRMAHRFELEKDKNTLKIKIYDFNRERKIHAIKGIRSISGLGLREAKDIIDTLDPNVGKWITIFPTTTIDQACTTLDKYEVTYEASYGYNAQGGTFAEILTELRMEVEDLSIYHKTKESLLFKIDEAADMLGVDIT